MTDGAIRERWVAEVFRSPHVSAEVKVFLLYLAHYSMDADGRVEEPREGLAAQMGVHPRKISAKFAAAVSGGLMRQMVRGQKHQTAVYEAVVPESASPQGASTRHPESGVDDDSQGAGFYHPETSQGASTRHAEDSQGAGFYHPEGSSQGADTRHIESSQDARTRHPENSAPYKDRAGAHSNADRSDAKPQAVVVPLFDEEKKIPPPAGASADEPEARSITAGAVVGAWIEAVQQVTGERPTPRLIGNISKQAKDLLNEGRAPERLVEAAAALGRKVGRGYTDLGHEYLIAASGSTGQANTGTDGRGGRGGARAQVNQIDWSKGFNLGGNRR